MLDVTHTENQIHQVSSFQDLLSTSFDGTKNAMCWKRELIGDFSEIVNKVALKENMTVLDRTELLELDLTEQGNQARQVLLNDLKVLKNHGASPIINVIKNYQRDDAFPFFPTDVYSWHVDRSPIPADTFLCTYHGASSDILPNSHATQKILIPEIRQELQKSHQGSAADFESFLSEFFFDLHYEAKPESTPINLGKGHLWKLAIDHPQSKVLPCLHRAPVENEGEHRLLMIC